MIYVFRPHASESANALAEAVDGIRIRRPENILRRARQTDKVIMWGAYLPDIKGIVLNNVPLQNKFEDALRLKEAGIRTVEVSRQRPMAVQQAAPIDPLMAIWESAQDTAEAFVNLAPARNPVVAQGIGELINALQRVGDALTRPAPVAPPPQPVGEWLGRTFNHVGGNDLLRPTTHPDFYSRKESIVNEFRVHSFFGRSIRAGKKIKRGPDSKTPFHGEPHAWIRSFDAGWQISYADDVGIKQKHRDIAHAAVKALGLSFGAVDIGELADGTLIVLEVNRAPGVEDGTTNAYGRAIRRWIGGEWTGDTE